MDLWKSTYCERTIHNCKQIQIIPHVCRPQEELEQDSLQRIPTHKLLFLYEVLKRWQPPEASLASN